MTADDIAPCPLCGEVFVRTSEEAVQWWCSCGRWTGVRFHERGELPVEKSSPEG